MCVINSYIIYRISKQTNNETPMTHHKFVKALIDQLRGDFRDSRTRPSTSSADNRLENKLHIPDVGQRKRDCIVCSDRKTLVAGVKQLIIVKRALISLQCILGSVLKFITLYKIIKNKILIFLQIYISRFQPIHISPISL